MKRLAALLLSTAIALAQKPLPQCGTFPLTHKWQTCVMEEPVPWLYRSDGAQWVYHRRCRERQPKGRYAPAEMSCRDER